METLFDRSIEERIENPTPQKGGRRCSRCPGSAESGAIDGDARSLVSEIRSRRGVHEAWRASRHARHARRASASRAPYQDTVWLNSYSGAGSNVLL